MAWSDLSIRNRAIARASIFLAIIIIVSVIMNVSDDETVAILRGRDLLVAAVGAALYAGIMVMVDRRLLGRKGAGGG